MSHPHYSDIKRPAPVKVYFSHDPGRTRQSEKAACDINRIMKRYEKTGVVPQNVRPLLYLDVSQMGDYRSALHNVELVEEVFMQQPPDLRSRFDNDPAAFLDWTSDPANRDELVELGLLPGEGVVEPVEGAVTPPPEGVDLDSPPGA